MSKIAVFLAVGILSASAWAQTGSGTLSGSVKDTSGAPIGRAKITITNTETTSQVDAVSDGTGLFRSGGLAPGSYRLDVDSEGFAPLTRGPVALQDGQTVSLDLVLQVNSQSEQVTVTARRVEEEVQSVPIPVSVMSGSVLEKAAAFNVNRMKELIPTVQFYSSNPRNSAINIRGLGSPFGLTNDGIEPGVGFYVDGVFYARPAAATMDFLDLERIEVLRGPQGTLFGKNTTSGAINIITRRPSFTPETNFELSYGNYGFIQAKGSMSGPLGKKLATRISFSGTQRDGFLRNVRTQDSVNDLSNLGFRVQFLYTPTDKIAILASGDFTRQRPNGYAQVISGVAPTLRPLNRQWNQIANDLGYTPPSYNAFDRLIDTDTPWRSTQDMGGGSVELDWTLGKGQLTAITAWRYWLWRPSNDRDFTALPITTVSAAPSRHRQWTQEIRYAATVNPRLNYLLGFFVFQQNLNPAPYHKQEQGAAAARYLLAPSANAATPGLLDGYGQNISFDYSNVSAAGFGQVEYYFTSRWRITPGLRLNHDTKKLDYDQQVYGGLQTTNTALIALQRSVLSPLTYKTDIADTNLSGQITLAYKASENVNAYATFATGFKSIGLNLGGVPTDAAGAPIVSAATVKPESVRHYEIGVKTRPLPGFTLNFSAFNTDIKNFQTQVVNAQVGVLRGYLANAEKVRARGFELDANYKVNDNFNLFASGAFNDGRYISFKDAPPPLEETGGPQVKDVSGSVLPGISKWAASFGGEFTRRATFLSQRGEFFARIDASYRSKFSSSPSFSRYLVVDSYALLNPRVGFRTPDGWAFSIWARNLGNTNYYELLSAAPGNSGLIAGLPGDPRTFGVTLSRSFGARSTGASRTASDTKSERDTVSKREVYRKPKSLGEESVAPEHAQAPSTRPDSHGFLESEPLPRALPNRPGLWLTDPAGSFAQSNPVSNSIYR
ncbi:MAG: TonB-dependent receptor [Bryobacteraceae bacterium]